MSIFFICLTLPNLDLGDFFPRIKVFEFGDGFNTYDSEHLRFYENVIQTFSFVCTSWGDFGNLSQMYLTKIASNFVVTLGKFIMRTLRNVRKFLASGSCFLGRNFAKAKKGGKMKLFTQFLFRSMKRLPKWQNFILNLTLRLARPKSAF